MDRPPPSPAGSGGGGSRRRGRGPGEFGSPGGPTRGEDGTVGVHDADLGRLTVFEPSGTYVADVAVAASYYAPSRSFGTVLSGVSLDIFAMLGGGNSGPLMTRFDVNIATGEVLREEASPSGPWDVACGKVVFGIPDRGEGWVFMACEGHLIFVGATGDATVLRAPTYLPELPDERDVARREEMIMSLNVRNGFPASTDVEERLEEYRATPKEYRLGTQHQLVDTDNRYWIATLRDNHDWSYLDVYENAQYVGSVKVRDRLRGFDLHGLDPRGSGRASGRRRRCRRGSPAARWTGTTSGSGGWGLTGEVAWRSTLRRPWGAHLAAVRGVCSIIQLWMMIPLLRGSGLRPPAAS